MTQIPQFEKCYYFSADELLLNCRLKISKFDVSLYFGVNECNMITLSQLVLRV